MEKVCSICQKKSSVGNTLVKLRGKYNPTSKKRRKPNLQWTRLLHGKNAGKRVLACAKCIKRMTKE